MKRVMLVKLVKLEANFGAGGDGSKKGNVGKADIIGRVSNFGAIGDSSDKVKLVILVL